MNWFIFALIAPIFWALSNIMDKFLITKIFDKFYFFLVWIGIFAMPICTVIFVLLKPTFVFPYSVIALSIGLLWGLYYLIYAKTLLNEEVSRTISLVFIHPIIVTILAGIFLKEIFSTSKYIGIVLLVTSGILLSYRKKGRRINLIGSLKLISILILMWSCLQVAEKITVEQIGYWSLYFWATLGVFLAATPFLLSKKTKISFIKSIKKIGRKGLPFLVTGEIFATLGSISFYVAISLGPVSLISAIGSLQPFFVFIYIIFLSIFIPKFLKEEINKYNILMKSIAIALVLVGTWLLI